MDMSWISSMFGGGGSGGGAAPAPSSSGQYYFGDTPVRQGVATGGGLPAGTEMPGGTTAGGVYPSAGSTPIGTGGESMPGGATAAPKPQNTMSGQSGVGAGLADSFKAIGDMIANYQTAGAYGKEVVNAQAPQTMIHPVLATFSVPQIARRV